MDIFAVLTMIGGLALFLYGMSTMGDGLVMLSGGKLEEILERLTSKRIMAVLLGAMVTAVIQSSSATTVMVVGFVNSGIMKLSQAVGIIMGANIGTTITSWILSLTGISSSNVFLKLLKPSSFSPVLAAIGIICVMSGKDGTKKKIVGSILLGFAVLMFGMETMSGAVAPLKENQAFTGMLTAFSNPILGMIAGAVLTAVIQSSSASVGILQALCLSGAVPYSTALPIIMGQNIGTCVTALISSVGASVNAKRAAFIHFYFNLVGTALFMAVFYTINQAVHFAFLTTSASATGIAVIHSLFNIGCALVLFPFADKLVELASLTVPEREQAKPLNENPAVLTALDERFLDSPSYALQLCDKAVCEMADYAKKAVFLAIEVQSDASEQKITQVIELEQLVDKFEDTIGSYLVKLAGKDMSAEDSRLLAVLFHSISDFERISDHAVNITEALQKLYQGGMVLSEEAKQELESLSVVLHDVLNLTTQVFATKDSTKAADVEPIEQVIDDLVLEMKQRHFARLRKGKCSLETGLLLEDIITHYQRVSDHCSKVAVTLIEIPSDMLDRHRYLNEATSESNSHFQREYLRLKRVYLLP